MMGLGPPDPNPGLNATASVQVRVQDGHKIAGGSSELSADGFIFELQVTDGTYDSLVIADDTMAWKEAFWDNTYGDGWDITTLSIASVQVPEPATLVPLGAGSVGFGLIRRRRKQ